MTRKLWDDFFDLLGINFPFGEPAKDALTLSVICLAISARLALKTESISIMEALENLRNKQSISFAAQIICSLISLVFLSSYYTASTLISVFSADSSLTFLSALIYFQLAILILVSVYIIISTSWISLLNQRLDHILESLTKKVLVACFLLFIAVYGFYESSFYFPQNTPAFDFLPTVYFYGVVVLFSLIPTASITTLILVDYKSPIAILAFLFFLVVLDLMLYVSEIILLYLSAII